MTTAVTPSSPQCGNQGQHPPGTPIRSTVTEILDYFGKCPRCGYFAGAAHIAHTYADGSTDSETVATCGQPCGWQGPAAGTCMTHAHRRR